MKIVFSIAHPKHVHIFKNLIKNLTDKGNKCYCLVVDKEITIQLLNYYKISFHVIGKNKFRVMHKIVAGFIRLFNIIKQLNRINPDIIVGQADTFFAIASCFFRKKNIVLPDTESAFLSNSVAIPLSSCVLASNSYVNRYKRIIRINAYLELAYLHRNAFKPLVNVKKLIGLKEEENYIIIRFVSWYAHHDIGHRGISYENKLKVIKEFSKYGKVLISSEDTLQESLKKYEIHVPPENMHALLAGATLFYGESATMAAESAVLGTPSIYLDKRGRGYTNDLEKSFGLVVNYSDSEEDQLKSIKKGVELLSCPNTIREWQRRKNNMFKEKIDYGLFLTWFINNYPKSHKVMKENPDHQYNFK